MTDEGRLSVAVTQRRRRAVLVLVLVATGLLGAAAPAVELSTSLEEFRGGTAEAAADDYVAANMSGGAANVTQSLVVIRGRDNVLTKDGYLRQLRAQRALLENETVARTLHPDQRPIGLANAVAITAIRTANGTDPENVSIEPRPPLDEQVAAIEGLNSYQRGLYTSYAVGIVLDDVRHTWPPGGGFAFVPTSYEARGKTAPATAIVVSHREETDPKSLTAAQVAMEGVVNRHLAGTEAFVLGDGVVNDELRRSSTDSLRIVGPFALLLLLAAMAYAYRDPVDVLLGLLGIGMVLAWTFGFMGHAGITFNQLFVAVPVLLMGLSVDYAIHVIMRQREEREALWASDDRAATEGSREEREALWASDGRADDADGRPEARREAPAGDPDGDEITRSMTAALAGVGGALVLVTFTTATGFLSNLVSGVGPIREFGVVSAVGIVAALVVFGAFVPALKVEVDGLLEARGRERHSRPFGRSGGRLSELLAVPILAARRKPVGVLALAALLTAGGLAGAATVDTTFTQEDLLVEETPAWAEGLPGPMQPTEYTVQRELDYVGDRGFVYDGTFTQILVRGDVTRPDTLERVQAAMDAANGSGVALELPNKNPGTRSPVTMMSAVADANESFARTLESADADGDGVPDRNLEAVYDAFYETRPDAAATVLHRVDGEYRALRIKVPVNGTVATPIVAREIRAAAAPVRGNGLRAVATGQPIMNQAVANQLLDTVVESLAVTLAVVLAGLTAVFRWRDGAASLGAVTMLPVALAVTWIVGTMALFGIPFNVMTALITSFTVGIGIDYSIHVTERYVGELERREDADEALRLAVLGTGGAMLGGAITDIAGVGVLAFAILAPLQQFGIITAVTIAYSFLASVVVLPSLLVLWRERFAPADLGAAAARGEPAD